MKKLIVLVALMWPAAIAFAAGPPCTWGTNGPTIIDFGLYPGTGTSLISGNFILRCRPSSATSVIAIDRGLYATTFGTRYMKHATLTDTLPYNLYTTAAGQTIWGDGVTGGTTVTFYNPDPGTKDFTGTIHARMPAIGAPALSTDVAAGVYEDRVRITNTADGVEINRADVIVRIRIAADCTVASFELVFDKYDPVTDHATTPQDVDTALEVLCTRGTAATISLDNGANFAAPWRRMIGPGGAFLQYQLYTTFARNTVWNTGNTVTMTSTSRYTPMGFRVYGRVPPAQDAGIGSYTDTIRATVVY